MQGIMSGMSDEAQIFVAALVVVGAYVLVRWLRTRKGPHVPMEPDHTPPQNMGADRDHELGDR